MRKAVFLSFDLGVRGDYEGLYRWLDAQGARECGDSVAFFNFESKQDLLSDVRKSLQKSIEITPKTRIYLIYRDGSKIKGQFLFGQRKAPAWTGYAPPKTGEKDEDVA